MKKKIITVSVLAVFSILFWFSIALNNEYLSSINTQLVIKDLPKNYSVSVKLPDEISISVKGSGWDLLKYTVFEKAEFEVSIHKIIGRKKIDLKDFINSNNWLSSNFKVIDINPGSFEIDFERSISKTVRIYSKLKLEFESGYDIVSDIEIEPQFVEIVGAPSLLKGIDSIFTIQKVFYNIKENFSENISLQLIKGIEYSKTFCTIKFNVQKIVNKNFENIHVSAINVPENQEIILYPSKVNILLNGGINILGKLTNDSINAFVDYNKLNSEENFVIPQIVVPKFIKLISIEPNNLEFVIKKN